MLNNLFFTKKFNCRCSKLLVLNLKMSITKSILSQGILSRRLTGTVFFPHF